MLFIQYLFATSFNFKTFKLRNVNIILLYCIILHIFFCIVYCQPHGTCHAIGLKGDFVDFLLLYIFIFFSVKSHSSLLLYLNMNYFLYLFLFILCKKKLLIL